jgi:hypothetical protein
MTTQAARVALFIPTTVPAIGNVIGCTNAPAGAQAPIATAFAANVSLAATAGETDGDTPHPGREADADRGAGKGRRDRKP